MQVVGYEGNKVRDNLPLVWGAAAIIDGDKLINAVSGSTGPKSNFDKYVEEGVICPLETPINIESMSEYFVLSIRKNLALREPYLVSHPGKYHREIREISLGANRAYYLFQDHEALTSWLYHLHTQKYVLVPDPLDSD